MGTRSKVCSGPGSWGRVRRAGGARGFPAAGIHRLHEGQGRTSSRAATSMRKTLPDDSPFPPRSHAQATRSASRTPPPRSRAPRHNTQALAARGASPGGAVACPGPTAPEVPAGFSGHFLLCSAGCCHGDWAQVSRGCRAMPGARKLLKINGLLHRSLFFF